MKKVCTKCSEEKDLSCFRRRNAGKYNDHYLGQCRKCERAYNNTHMDCERRKKRAKERFNEIQGNPDLHKRLLDRHAKYRKEKRETYRKYHSKHIKKQVAELSDSYILRTYFKTTKGRVPPDLIEAFRIQLKLKRLLKQKSK